MCKRYRITPEEEYCLVLAAALQVTSRVTLERLLACMLERGERTARTHVQRALTSASGPLLQELPLASLGLGALNRSASATIVTLGPAGRRVLETRGVRPPLVPRDGRARQRAFITSQRVVLHLAEGGLVSIAAPTETASRRHGDAYRTALFTLDPTARTWAFEPWALSLVGGALEQPMVLADWSPWTMRVPPYFYARLPIAEHPHVVYVGAAERNRDAWLRAAVRASVPKTPIAFERQDLRAKALVAFDEQVAAAAKAVSMPRLTLMEMVGVLIAFARLPIVKPPPYTDRNHFQAVLAFRETFQRELRQQLRAATGSRLSSAEASGEPREAHDHGPEPAPLQRADSGGCVLRSKAVPGPSPAHVARDAPDLPVARMPTA